MTITLQASDSLEYFHDTDYELLGNIANYNVVSGCGLTENPSTMGVTIAAGVVTHNGTSTTVAGGSVTLVADASNKRWSYVTVDNTGAGVVVSGDPAASSSVEPTKPELGDRVLLKMYKIEAAQTVAANIAVALDKRLFPPTSSFFDSERTAFRANRRVLAMYSASTTSGSNVGFGLVSSMSELPAVSGEYLAGQSTTGTSRLIHPSGNVTYALTPNHSPRMLLRQLLPASSANLTSLQVGFFDTLSSLTANGAYLRMATTGNLFFVTRQGGSETAADLGAGSRAAITGYEIETADAGVTWVCRNQAGTVLATHTTNVPTASAGLFAGYNIVIATANITNGLAYMVIEGTFS